MSIRIITALTTFIALTTPAFAGATRDSWLAEPHRIFAASEVDLSDVIWSARPLVIFANSPLDPTFRAQMELLSKDLEAAAERDLMIVIDTEPAFNSALRNSLRPKGFVWVLIGKDGKVKLRKPFAWDMRELGRVIDKMPMRQQQLNNK